MRKEYIHFFYIPDIKCQTLFKLGTQVDNFLRDNRYRFVTMKIFINPVQDVPTEKFKVELIYSS